MADSQNNGLAIAALVVGLIGFFTAWIPILGLIIAVVAIVLGALGMKKAKQQGGKDKGMAVAGLVLGIVAAFVGLLMIIGMIFMADVLSPGNFMSGMCSFSLGFTCSGATYEDGKIVMPVKNMQWEPVTVTGIRYATDDEPMKRCGPETPVTADKEELMTLECEVGPREDDLESYDIEVTYTIGEEEKTAEANVMT